MKIKESKNNLFILITSLCLLFLLLNCNDFNNLNYRINNEPNEDELSSRNDILTFNFLASENMALDINVIGTISGTSINLIVPSGTDSYYLIPDITISPGATVTPGDGKPVNFLTPVIYTVITSDMITKKYTVTVTVEDSDFLIIPNDTIGRSERVHTAVLDNKNRLLVGGAVLNSNWDAAIWRFNSDGTLDTSFGNNGLVLWNSSHNNIDYIERIIVKADGSLWLGGVSYDSLSAMNALLGCLLPDGQPRIGFSSSGFKFVNIDNSKINVRVDIAFDSNDRLLVSGIYNGTFEPAVTRISTSGVVDTSFGNMGYFQPVPSAEYKYQGGIIVDSGYVYKATVSDIGVTKIYKLKESDGSLVDYVENIPFKGWGELDIQGEYLYIPGYSATQNCYAWAKVNKTNLSIDLTYATKGVGSAPVQTEGGRGSGIYVNTNEEAYIAGSCLFREDGKIIKTNSSGFVDTTWSSSGSIVYVEVGGISDYVDSISHVLFYNEKMFIFGTTGVQVNSALYQKMFVHYTSQ